MPTATALTAKQRKFAAEYLLDSNGAAAAVRAGYAPGSAKVAASRLLTSDNPVRRAIQARQEADSERLGVGRDRVLHGLLEAVNQARVQSDPMAMISGLREIARLQGYYQPRQVNVAVSTDQKQGTVARLETMSDADLVALIEAGSTN